MRFCPKCGALMVAKRDNNNGELYWACPQCGYREQHSVSSSNLSVLRHTIEHSEKERIVVISNQPTEVLPRTRATCPRCGHGEAYYWLVQTRRADEPPTRFFKCVNCGHVWREYD